MDPELPRLVDEARTIATEAQREFGQLTAQQLNWKPTASEWSVAQCLDHLIVSNSGYFPIAANVARGAYRTSLKERLPLLPRLFGALVLRAVQPESQRKFKASPNFQPSRSDIGSDIVGRFVSQQHELIDHINLTKDVDLRKTIITSPVASFVTYSLLDGYKIVVAHEKRHLAQARRVTQREGFPKDESAASVGTT